MSSFSITLFLSLIPNAFVSPQIIFWFHPLVISTYFKVIKILHMDLEFCLMTNFIFEFTKYQPI